MKVNELARHAGATPDVVRYYTRIGLLEPSRDPSNGYKRFSHRDLRRLRFIRQAKRLGFSLSEIAEILGHAERSESPCPRVRQILESRIRENGRRLLELMALQERMERALARWNEMPDGVPDGHTVCHLIESIEEPQAH
jgi:MerR family Zn(II)-responsive transcriptional regulator of zntA